MKTVCFFFHLRFYMLWLTHPNTLKRKSPKNFFFNHFFSYIAVAQTKYLAFFKILMYSKNETIISYFATECSRVVAEKLVHKRLLRRAVLHWGHLNQESNVIWYQKIWKMISFVLQMHKLKSQISNFRSSVGLGTFLCTWCVGLHSFPLHSV